MTRTLVVRRHAIQRIDQSISVASEALNQLGRVVKRHHRDFVLRFQTSERIGGRVSNLFAKWVEAPASVDKQDDRKRQCISSEVAYHLSDSILEHDEVLFFEIADRPRRFLLENKRVLHYKINLEPQSIVGRGGGGRLSGSRWEKAGNDNQR